MAPSDSILSETRSPAGPDAPWDLDAPWILDPPSRLTFSPDEAPAPRRPLRGLGRRLMALVVHRRLQRGRREP